jgi:hypothetical protein
VAGCFGEVLADAVRAFEPVEIAAVARAFARHEKRHRPRRRLRDRNADDACERRGHGGNFYVVMHQTSPR